MSGWNLIKGHEHIKNYFRNAINKKDILHAYIISGDKGCGKKTLAKVFAAALVCTSADGNPCLECDECKKALHGSNPDIIYVNHEKSGSISVDEIRKQLIMPMSIRPYYSNYKVFIIDDAHLMTAQAQNALLKTLEEPPEYGVIILLSVNEDMLLQTVLSRAVVLHCGEIPRQEVKKYLMEHKQIPDYKAEMCSVFAQGNIGRAIDLATNENFYATKEAAIDLIKMLPHTDMYQLLLRVKDITGIKERIADYLDFIYAWYHDILMYKSSGSFKFCLYTDEEIAIENQAEVLSYESVEKIFSAIDEARKGLNSNVNFELVIEVLLMKIKENYL